jgi:hypothetical protein
MLAIATVDAQRALTTSDGFDVKNGKPTGLIVAAERRVAEAKAALVERHVIAGYEDMGAKWTVERREADLRYETTELDRLRNEMRSLEEIIRKDRRDFASVAKRNHLSGEPNEWAKRGQQWRADIRNLVQLYKERVDDAYTLVYRRNIADTARALVEALDAPIDPTARAFALSDIKQCFKSIDEDVLRSTIAKVRSLAYAAREAADDFANEIDGQFSGGSPWGEWIFDMRSWASENGLPCEIGGVTAKAGRYSEFSEFLLAINETMPAHIRDRRARSTFVSRAHDAVRNARRPSGGVSES